VEHLVHWDDVTPRRLEVGHLAVTTRELGSHAGTVSVGVTRWEVDPGKWSTPAHAELIEEEIFYVLGGSGLAWMDGETYEIGAGDCMVYNAAEEEAPVRPGHVLGRPPGTGVAHSFRAADNGMTYLVYGTREPNDIAYYPDSNKVNFRGIKLIGRIERLDYWDGEPAD